MVPSSYLLAGHLLTLPRPDQSEVLRAALRDRRVPGNPDRWTALHVLYADCGCSRRILDHLLERRALPGLDERIVLVLGEDETEAGALRPPALAAGFTFEVLTPEDLEARLGVESSPLLVIADPAGAARYVGGYTDRKRGPDIEDAAILARLRQGERVAPLPVFGCATSKKLQRKLDPLSLKY
jgi:hypothetical protein